MFSGIVQTIGKVLLNKNGRIVLKSEYFLANAARFALGSSVCISGVCLTVVEIDADCLTFELGSETLRRTTLAALKEGGLVNIEPALRVGDALDGHLVLGHVDVIAEILELSEEENALKMTVARVKEIARLICPKGSITMDGVSLTVGEVDESRFLVYIVPFTREHTTLGSLKVGDLLNIEADCIARYVQSVMPV